MIIMPLIKMLFFLPPILLRGGWEGTIQLILVKFYRLFIHKAVKINLSTSPHFKPRRGLSKLNVHFFSCWSTLIFRLCAEAIVRDIGVLKNEIDTLPSTLQRKIEFRLHNQRSDDTQKHGYNLRQRPNSLWCCFVQRIFSNPQVQLVTGSASTLV